MNKIIERIEGVEKKTDELKERVDIIEKRVEEGVIPNIECYHCGYSWFTRSKLKYVSCPSCGQKNPTTKEGIRKMERKIDKRVGEYIRKIEKENKKYPTVFK